MCGQRLTPPARAVDTAENAKTNKKKRGWTGKRDSREEQ